MKSNIFIPKTLKIGFCNRIDTYTGKLAYIIYYDNKNKLRKEPSWNSWRDKSIEPLEIENIPISGFVLNKKVGGESYGWNPRQTYTRIFDPREFEFEITIPNLLYILENTNSIKGKGLEGDFVYGWSGTELILIPTSSPDYTQLVQYNDSIINKEKITAKTLILGGTYLTKDNRTWIYLGEFENHHSYKKGTFFFSDDNGYTAISKSSINTKIIKCISTTPVDNYAYLVDDLMCHDYISPIDTTLTKFSLYTEKEIVDFLNSSKGTYGEFFLPYKDGVYIELYCYSHRPNDIYFNSSCFNNNYSDYRKEFNRMSILEVFNKYTLYKRERFLQNGKPYKKGYLL